MNHTSDVADIEETEANGSSRFPRLLIAVVVFVAFEALFIWGLGDLIYDFSYLSFGMWGLVALAGSGYLGLGVFSRSWLSGLALVAPLLIAVYFVNVVWTTDLGSGGSFGVNSNFAEIWLTLSWVFVPAWAVGVVIATRNRSLGSST